MDRRSFMKTGSAATVASILGPELWAQLNEAVADGTKPLPRRPLGKTGESLSIIGLGGIVVMGGEQKDADARVREAIDRGVNYFDVAPTYGRGEAEQKLGPALKPYRDKVFLACKTQKRDRAGAEAELDASLKQLQTDHFDLYQMHAISDVEKDVKRALAPGGAVEAFVEARKQGKVRFLGFSAHSAEAALAAMESGAFDTILYPVNFVCHERGRFDQEVLKAAEARGMGRLALKAMALTRWPKEMKRRDRSQPKCWYQPVDDPALVALALRWTLAQGVTAALPPGDENLFRLALNVASLEAELAPEEVTALRAVAAKHDPIFSRPAV
jgi:aryl-alcohol dehydrogenase-like predicted oxidoreductase